MSLKSNTIRLKLYTTLGLTADNEVKMLDSFFQHQDDFKGVTGSSFYFVDPQGIEERNDIDNIKDNYDFIWREQVQAQKTEESLDEWAESFKQEYIMNSDSLFVGHDTSYIHHLDRDQAFLDWHNSRFKTELKGCYDDEEGTFECIGGGRCFNSEEEDLVSYIDDSRALLHDLARSFEAGNIDIETIEQVLIANDIKYSKEKV